MREKVLIFIIAAVVIVPVVLLYTWPSPQRDVGLDPESIVEQALAAHGGRANFGSLRSMKRSFERFIPGLGKQSATMTILYPDKFHMVIREMDGGYIDEWVYHPPYLWRRNKDGEAVPMHPAENQAILYTIEDWRKDMDCMYLLDLPLRLSQLQYLRRVQVEDRNCHLLQQEVSAYNVINYYFDVDTFRLVKRERIAKQDGQLHKEEEFYYDYSEAGGLWWPSHITYFRDAELSMEEIVTSREVNSNISEDLFVYPEERDR